MAKNKDNKIVQNGGRENRRDKSEPLLAVPEDERENPPSYLPRLSVVLPASSNSSTDHLPTTPPQKAPSLSHGDESMTVVLSAFYAKLLIVLGLALPVTSTIQTGLYTNITTDMFTLYLYTGSMIFLGYTFYHLRIAKQDKKMENVKGTRYGSFYLHIGVAGFGVGSIIYSCLQFGGYFDLSGDCQMPIIAIKPAFRILFLVAQTVFIFSYTDILHPMRGVVIDRFGLMHLIATNVCEWLNVIIQETRDDILKVAYGRNNTHLGRPALFQYANISPRGLSKIEIMDQIDNITFEEEGKSIYNYNDSDSIFFNASSHYFNLTIANNLWICNISDMITPLINSVNPYLRPCGVEYSLLCSVIIAVIFNDLCTVPGTKPHKIPPYKKDSPKQCCPRNVKSNSHFSVDCGSAHKGLFSGIAVLAGTIVSLMLFDGLFQNKTYVDLALLQINVWETILFIVMTVGSAACIQRMRKLPLRRIVSTLVPLEHALLLVTQCGVYLYYLFQIIGAGFLIQRYPEERRATRIISPLCALIQSSCQTLLVLDSWTRRCSGSGRQRPGRQLVTFLLVGNFALWLLNRVKNSRAEYHPLQMEFYGVWAWTLITHISVPLLVCYRFQATVCFFEIWKNSYKINKDPVDSEEIELKSHNA